MKPHMVAYYLGMPLILLTMFISAFTNLQPVSAAETVVVQEKNALNPAVLEDDVPVDQIYNNVKVHILEPNIKHIGNYVPAFIEQMSTVAEELGMKHFTTYPYSQACNRPNAVCSWDADYEAMHIEASRTQEFWDLFCDSYPDNIFCSN